MPENNPVSLEPTSFEPILVESHSHFRRYMREIVNRLNNTPEIARLVLVNPIYALRDINVRLSKEMEQHIFQTFTSPPAKQRRLTELETQIQPELDKLSGKPRIPSTPQERADLLFRSLGVTPLPQDSPDQLDRERLIAYAKRHPLVPLLMEYERVSRSGLVFFPRSTYDAYKSGKFKQQWLNSIRFGAPPADSES
jgi:hypothetical protein